MCSQKKKCDCYSGRYGTYATVAIPSVTLQYNICQYIVDNLITDNNICHGTSTQT